ncbi:isochorismatase family protein [Bacillus swezeyi]|uniref:isochorismatase family protein n=1 Tax=Bacillus swezeyi TaxID=1925020 RepID=UPI002E1C8449|nr:isochorismatase family protein [Bacillus swezeyi]MED2977638.1 isochorismatase family protein [Bacillus swezeyi]
MTHLVICGMMTHMCIDAKTLAVKGFGYECTIIADACATVDLHFHGHSVPAEHVHHAFLSALDSTYASVLSCEEYLAMIDCSGL